MSAVKSRDLPRCIAHVPERMELDPNSQGWGEKRRVQAHQCTYRAHAYDIGRGILCRIHAGLRVRRRKPRGSLDQLDLALGATA